MTGPPFPYFGAKTRVAEHIIALLPAHHHYVEPFAGSLAVLLAKRPSRMETVNDLDAHLTTFWRVLRERPYELVRACALTPHGRYEHELSYSVPLEDLDDLERARRVWVRLSQGRSATLRKTGWRFHIDPSGSSISMPAYLEAYVARMGAVAQRLHRVSLECRPALDLIAAYGAFDDVCLYVDPPYLGTTRCRNYRTEMASEAEHTELLDHLRGSRASVVLSGYPNTLYDRALRGWDRVEIRSGTTQGGTNAPRTEVVWSNRAIADPTLFDAIADAQAAQVRAR